MRIDDQFDAAFADVIAKFESYNKHLYRPNTYLHKWWARRCGTTFRTILKHLVQDETRHDYYAPGGLKGKTILDPMMGGGTTLHEAIRLGANVVGADIDPIPVLQARASLSDVPLVELKRAYRQLHHQLRQTLADYYQTTCPSCTTSHEMRFMLYGLRCRCACRQVVIVDSFTLRHNNDDSRIHIEPTSHHIFRDEQLIAAADGVLDRLPLVEKGDKRCPDCQQPYQPDRQPPYYQRCVPFAVAGQCRQHGMFFRPIGRSEREQIARADALREALPFDPAAFRIAGGPKSSALRDKGIGSYLDLFSSRQLLYLQAAIELMADFPPLIRLNLALLVSTSLEFNALLCGYKGARQSRPGAIRHVFAYHAYSFPYTVVENNPVYPRRSSGSLQNLFHSRIVRGRQWALAPQERRIVNGRPRKVTIKGETDVGVEAASFADLHGREKGFLLIQGSSINLDIPDNSIDFVVTDPPYFDSVQYSDLAAFFRVWLKELLPADADWAWEYALEEAAVDQQTNGNGQYQRILSAIFAECHRVLKENGRLIFTYHHWNPKGWAALTKTLRQAGFVLLNRYVVHAENRSSVHIANQNAFLHDVILVLAPDEAAARQPWSRPDKIRLDDSDAFCRDCGTALGWLLNQEMDEAAIDRQWHTLLSSKNSYNGNGNGKK